MICSYAGCGQPAVLVWLCFDDSSNSSVHNVFSCATHQLSTDRACLCHLSTCTAPDANVPSCNCTPVNIAQPLGSTVSFPQSVKAL
jgi:hypothetical protein